MSIDSPPYDLDGHISQYRSGINLYRGEDFAQPRALEAGDVLSNGWPLMDTPHDMGNGSMQLRFGWNIVRYVALRLPLQLQPERQGVLPGDLHPGQILQTGDVILAEPMEVLAEESRARRTNQHEHTLLMSGGMYGHKVWVPADIELAVSDEEFPPDPRTKFGAFVLEKIKDMHPDALRHLYSSEV